MNFKVKFWVDENLLYIMQQVTGDSTAKLVSYFQHLVIKTAEDHYSKKSNQLNKTIRWLYGDKVPYRLHMYSSSRSKTEVVASLKPYNLIRKIDVKSILDQDAEYSLGLDGSTPVANIRPPVTKAPLNIKKYLNAETIEQEKTHVPNLDFNNLPEELKNKYGELA